MADTVQRLVIALRKRPDLLAELLDTLGVPCEYPECPNHGTVLTPGMTSYEWDGTGQDPNRDRFYCPEHSQEHIDFWQAQWDEYYSGLI
jgi:hypothetical protein